MGDPTLFPVKAATFTREVGPVNAIRASYSRRAFIRILFWLVLLLGVGSLIVTHSLGGLLSFGIAIGFALLIAVWGQYWRDVESAARRSLGVAIAEVSDAMRREGIDPRDEAERGAFRPSLLTGSEAEHWAWYQELLDAPDVQQLMGWL